MVGNRPYGSGQMPTSDAEIPPERLRERIDAIPALSAVRAAAAGLDAYLVGGAVRDLIRGLDRIDLDVAVQAPPDAVAAMALRVDPAARIHDRFGTATARVAGADVDLATTRAEAYEHPGALPRVRPATLADDLARRDFTINAMAVPLAGEPRLVDPHGGHGDLEARRLRVLHDRSFEDDPTRALRAGRYAARLGLRVDSRTADLLRTVDLATVSADRAEAELRRLAAEPDPVAALRLLVEWGVVEADTELAGATLRVLDEARWGAIADRATAFLAAGGVRAGRYRAPPGADRARGLAVLPALSPSELTARARGHASAELAIARALGAEWLDRYLDDWRGVRLEIGGRDLLAAGVAEGPAIGRGLEAALAAKLDGRVEGREEELAEALAAARADD